MEISEARKRLWPLYKDTKKAHPDESVRIVYPAKLICGKTVVKDEFPDWNQILSQTRLVDFPILDDESTSNIDNPRYPLTSQPRHAANPVSVRPSSSVGNATLPVDRGHVVTPRQAVHDVMREQQTHVAVPLDLSYVHGATGSTQVTLKPNNPKSSSSNAVNTKSYNSQVFCKHYPTKPQRRRSRKQL